MRDGLAVISAIASAIALLAGCSGGQMETAVVDASQSHTAKSGDAGDAGRFMLTPVDATGFPDVLDATTTSDADATVDAAVDAPPSRFITQVVSFTLGTCAGYHGGLPGPATAESILVTVAGPPQGAGASADGTDVVSLGGGGSIVVGFGENAIVDGPGPDFIVFENPFDYGGTARYVEPGEVSVSDDGENWSVFPCTDTTQDEPDGGYGATQCGGMTPVFSNPNNSISPFDVANAGGDPYDLKTVGLTHARFVRIVNKVASEYCPDSGVLPTKNGFDLDAIAIVNAALP